MRLGGHPAESLGCVWRSVDEAGRVGTGTVDSCQVGRGQVGRALSARIGAGPDPEDSELGEAWSAL